MNIPAKFSLNSEGFQLRDTSAFVHFSILSWPFSHSWQCAQLAYTRTLCLYSTFDGHVQGIYIEHSFHCLFVGKEVALLLDLELSFGGKYLSEQCHFHDQLSFENWSVSYITNM